MTDKMNLEKKQDEEIIAIPYNINNILITSEIVQQLLAKFGTDIIVKDITHYQQALTHKSYLYNSDIWSPSDLKTWKEELGGDVVELRHHSYERMETLGDTVLKQVILYYLYLRYPEENEGFLTRIKTKIENRESFAKWSQHLGLGKYVLVSQHIDNINGRNSEKIMEDIMESFIGALFIDQGYDVCDKLIMNIMDNTYADIVDYAELLCFDNNYKDQLLRLYHKNNWGNPLYEQISYDGPAHNRVFTIGVLNPHSTGEKYIGIGQGNSKKKAEQIASHQVLSNMGMLQDELIKSSCH